MQLTDMVTVTKDETKAMNQGGREGKENKYTYAASMNQIIASLREHLITACFAASEEERERALLIIGLKIQRSIVPVRPERTVERSPTPRKVTYHYNRKLPS